MLFFSFPYISYYIIFPTIILQIYYASMDKGPDSIDVTTGYFHLANTFVVTKQGAIAERIFDKVVTIWTHYLSVALQRILDSSTANAQGKKKTTNKRKDLSSTSSSSATLPKAKEGALDETVSDEEQQKVDEDEDLENYDELLSLLLWIFY